MGAYIPKDYEATGDLIDYPDAKKHQTVSFVKSGIRIFGYVLMIPIYWNPVWAIPAAIVLIASEVIGIYEELV